MAVAVAEYGSVELSLLFFVTAKTNDQGFIFKDNQYSWADIEFVAVGEGREPRLARLWGALFFGDFRRERRPDRRPLRPGALT
jgi:hypothetical protein